MIYTMINEAGRCLDEEIVKDASTVDVGMIFGTGFPPFRAGLLQYADKVGLQQIVADIKRFQTSTQSARFELCSYLEKSAASNAHFHPSGKGAEKPVSASK